MAKKKLFAAIDVGSHEIQMKIAEIDQQAAPVILEQVRRTLAIGSDTYQSGRISQAVLSECVSILADFKKILKSYRIGNSRVVATSAFREAANSMLAVEQIRRSCGFDLEILSNSEERYFNNLATIAAMPDFQTLAEEGSLLVEIGSGSIQLTVYSRGEMIFSQNMLLGSLRIRELLADLERRTADFSGLMEAYISNDLDNYHVLEPKGIAYKNLILSGGEMDQFKKLAGQKPETVSSLSVKQFNKLYQQLLTTRPIDLALDKVISVEHASLLLPAAIIIRKLLDFTGAKTILLPPGSLSDGLLVDIARRKYHYDPSYDQDQDILSVCRQLSDRFETDPGHIAYVEQAALQLFDQTDKIHSLSKRSRLLLQAAALLHDCGKYVSITDHSLQSYNIIMASEIIGLKPNEKQIVAWTARLHSGLTVSTGAEYETLDKKDQLKIVKMTALLRLADALDTSHSQKIKGFEVAVRATELVIKASTDEDITLETWTFENKCAFFHDVFGIQPSLQIRR